MTYDTNTIKDACKSLTVALPGGILMPRLGQGTWHIGDKDYKRQQEIESLRLGYELGMTLIDTAEMYGDGKAERIVGEAIKDIPRNELFLVSKVLPQYAGRLGIFDSCKDSLKRLKTDYLDLYLLHWRGNVPLEETVYCMERLKSEGLIRSWGVSNFDTGDMSELWYTQGGKNCAVNQVLYHLGSRGIEYDLLPWMRRHKVPLMAYCPIAQGGSLKSRLLTDPAVNAIARKHQITPVQVLLSFVLRDPDVIAIPKAGTPEHVRLNAETALVKLEEEELSRLNSAFPAPNRKVSLDIL